MKDTNLLLPRNHPFQKGVQRILKIINPLLLKSRNFDFGKLRNVLKLVLRVQSASLRFGDL